MDAEFIDRQYAANRERGMNDTLAYEAALRAEAEEIERERDPQKKDESK